MGYTFQGDGSTDGFGSAVSNAGDVNRDGVDDIVVGGLRNDAAGMDAGMARVFSGSDGSTLYTFLGTVANQQFGSGVGPAGDVNGDGYGDVVVSGLEPATNIFAFTTNGVARVYSGFDGSLIHSLAAPDLNDAFGAAVDGGADFNGDGFDDFIVTASHAPGGGMSRGVAYIYSGLDASLIDSISGSTDFINFGASASVAGDIDMDGFSDIVVGAPFAGATSVSGQTRVFRSSTLPVKSYKSDQIAEHFLTLTWIPDGGDPNAVTGTIECTDGLPGASGIIAASNSFQDTLYFGYLPVLIDLSQANPYAFALFGFDVTGSLTVPGITRHQPGFGGFRSFVQVFQFSPLTFSSNALRIATFE